MHMPMLPQELNSGICSLSQGNLRYAVTLSIEINEKGIADFTSLQYELSVIQSAVRLTYQEADELIRSKDEQKFILSDKCKPEIENSVKAKLKLLDFIAQSRKAFRE